MSRRGIPEEFDDARPDLIPIIQNRWSFERSAYDSVTAEKEVGGQPFSLLSDHLGIGLAYDMPEYFAHVPQS